MASQHLHVFDVEAKFRFRLMRMCETASARCLRKILDWLTPKWKNDMTFKKYLEINKIVTMKVFKDALNGKQKQALTDDPEGKNWDVSLLCILIQLGGEGLADRNDPVWKDHSDRNRLESLIAAVKKERNVTVHCQLKLDAHEFFEKTETLRSLLKDTLHRAGAVTQRLSDDAIREADDLINKLRDDPLDPKDFNEYKQQVMFQEQLNFVKVNGANALCNRHEKFSSLTPVSRLAEANFTVSEIFTDMVLKLADKTVVKIECENILEDIRKTSSHPVILLEGPAGVGKTTVVKWFLDDWRNKRKKVKNLDSMDLLFHVECRDQVKSFKELLGSSMGDLHKNFQGEDLTLVALALRCLIIVDGLDELNVNTEQIFQEVLNLKKNHDIALMITTRPEAVQKYFTAAMTHQVATKHIKLIGISQRSREEFVKKYFEAIGKKMAILQDIDLLLAYLNKTGGRMKEVWRLPYNLALVTVLWALKPEVVSDITTAPELYWQIHLLCRSKLTERLERNKATQDLPASIMGKKIDYFLNSLGWESLKGLENDEVNLTQIAYDELKKKSHDLNIPAEEMISAFLKSVTTCIDTRYSFSHKGHQEFMGAYYIREQLVKKGPNHNMQRINQTVLDALIAKGIPQSAHRKVIKAVEESLIETKAKTLKNIFEQLQGSYPSDFRKYENLLRQLIGLFHINPSNLDNDAKEAVLDLLKKAGLDDNSWLEILTSVKCDNMVTQYVIQTPEMKGLRGRKRVEMSNISAYVSLLRALQTPIEKVEEIQLNVYLDEYVSEFEELVDITITRKLHLKLVSFDMDFKRPSMEFPGAAAVKKLLHDENCQVARYMGPWRADFVLPRYLETLCVSIHDADAYISLMNMMEEMEDNLESLCISINVDFKDVERLPPLYAPTGTFVMIYLIGDVNDYNLRQVFEILQRMIPRGAENLHKYGFIKVPQASLTLDSISLFVEVVREIHSWPLCLPKSLCPSPEVQKELNELWTQTGRIGKVQWPDYSDRQSWPCLQLYQGPDPFKELMKKERKAKLELMKKEKQAKSPS